MTPGLRKIRYLVAFVFACACFSSCGLETYTTLTPVTSYTSPQAAIPQYAFTYNLSDPGASNIQGFKLYYKIYASSTDLSADGTKISSVNTTGASGETVKQQLEVLKYKTIKFQDPTSTTTTASSDYLSADKTQYSGQIQVSLTFAWPPIGESIPRSLGSYAAITDQTVSPTIIKYFQMQRSLNRFGSTEEIEKHKSDFYMDTTTPNISETDEDYLKSSSATSGYSLNVYVFVYGIEFTSITDIYSSVTYLGTFTM
jgi:hypothetical protein